MDGIKKVAEGIVAEIQRIPPKQRKTRRNNLAFLVATMLDVRSANLMDLAAGLPRDTGRIDMRYQWISRMLMNRLIDPDAVMAPFARESLSQLAGADVCLMADRFYGTADLIAWCQDRQWDYRLRLKGDLVVGDAEERMTTGQLAKDTIGMSAVRFVKVFDVEDQPKFEAGIGPANANCGVPADINGQGEVRVVVVVEYSQDMVSPLK